MRALSWRRCNTYVFTTYTPLTSHVRLIVPSIEARCDIDQYPYRYYFRFFATGVNWLCWHLPITIWSAPLIILMVKECLRRGMKSTPPEVRSFGQSEDSLVVHVKTFLKFSHRRFNYTMHRKLPENACQTLQCIGQFQNFPWESFHNNFQ